MPNIGVQKLLRASAWTTGSGAPTAAGLSGDMYLDTGSGIVYKLATDGTGWAQVTTLSRGIPIYSTYAAMVSALSPVLGQQAWTADTQTTWIYQQATFNPNVYKAWVPATGTILLHAFAPTGGTAQSFTGSGTQSFSTVAITATFDPFSGWDAGNNQYQAPFPGWYEVSGRIGWASDAAGYRFGCYTRKGAIVPSSVGGAYHNATAAQTTSVLRSMPIQFEPYASSSYYSGVTIVSGSNTAFTNLKMGGWSQISTTTLTTLGWESGMSVKFLGSIPGM